MRPILLTLFLLCTQSIADAAGNFKVIGKWSTETNGLRGRILYAEKATAESGLREGIVYLELQNVSLGDSIHIYYDASKFSFRPNLRDHDGKVLRDGLLGSSWMPEPCWLVLPYDSTLCLRTGNYSTSPGKPGLIITGGFVAGNWFIPEADNKEYYLSATFTASVPKDETRPRMWEGTLELPPIKIPHAKE